MARVSLKAVFYASVDQHINKDLSADFLKNENVDFQLSQKGK